MLMTAQWKLVILNALLLLPIQLAEVMDFYDASFELAS
jgi:hypothetical protein